MVGEDVLHTLDLPHANSSSDHVLLTLAREQHRIVVTKDNDFLRDYQHRLEACDPCHPIVHVCSPRATATVGIA